METRELLQHKFVERAFKYFSALPKDVHGKPLDIEFGDGDKIDEYQFYVLGVGSSIAHLLTLLEQLERAVILLNNFHYSSKVKKLGITRFHHLHYNIENYLIRLRSIIDRVLQLINTVFHLQLDESTVTFQIIIKNVKVERTPIKANLNDLRKFIESNTSERNAIVHRHSLVEPALRKLELLYLFDEEKWRNNSKDKALSFKGLTDMRSKILRDYLEAKRGTFFAINNEVFSKISKLYDHLYQQHFLESARLRKYLYE
ncbi:MAG: Cthe_2314 family HEPN domain-containing protein [Pseudomonadota bacterium]